MVQIVRTTPESVSHGSELETTVSKECEGNRSGSTRLLDPHSCILRLLMTQIPFAAPETCIVPIVIPQIFHSQQPIPFNLESENKVSFFVKFLRSADVLRSMAIILVFLRGEGGLSVTWHDKMRKMERMFVILSSVRSFRWNLRIDWCQIDAVLFCYKRYCTDLNIKSLPASVYF